MKKLTLNIWNSKNTIFTVTELANYLEYGTENSLRQKLSNYVKNWYIENVARGVYSIPGKQIDRYEFANKVYSPSYISFFSALYHYWIIFQAEPKDVYLAYMKSENKYFEKLEINIHLKNLKKELLLNTVWLEFKDTYTIASKERAFLDTIYLYDNIYFDNIDILDIEEIRKIISIYPRQNMMKKRIKKYFPNY